ncbi:hypothetical protein GQ55_6G087300 [Panicum hallii var. hallii]|uniref:Cyclic nucleotide-binding domain-containing protein n=1 Tax=Panicum hallii var. hallii TaxID=1504633 RepID=A0A2T7D5H3_9POAL|nr:hypothetical protein GQ55_6G087300 [Panicum hallii var. hallii]
MKINRHFAIVLTYLLIDMFFVVHIATRFFTAYIDPGSIVLGKGELVTDPKKIAYRYIRTNFFIDLAAALPVPQILVWAILPSLSFRYIDTSLFLIILVQSAVRLYIVIQLSVDIIKTVGFLTKNGWTGSSYNLFLYLVASHMTDNAPCDFKFLDCIYGTSNQSQIWAKTTKVFTECNVDTMQNGVFEISFPEKYFYSLCTFGDPQETSSYIGESLFAIGLTLLSIGLFAQLIGSMTILMRKSKCISRFLEYKWIATRNEEDSILKQLPFVPLFSAMDHQLLDAICERMNYLLCSEGTYIIREGEPVKVMTFVFRGKLESCTTDGGRTDFFNSIILKPGDFCGEELLTWALLPSSGDCYPLSTRTVRTITEFEAFSLQADDLKFVASTFRMMHSKHLQHIFRFHSHQWRTWAARFIQSAWRRHISQQKTAERSLSSRWKSFFSLIDDNATEERRQNMEGSSSSRSRAAEFPFSKIATIFLKAQNNRPEEPDFSIGDHPN